MQDLMLRFTDFSGRYKQGLLRDQLTNLNAALTLESEFEELMTNPPLPWRYRTVHTKENPEVILLGYFHVYQTFWAAQTWNGLRSMRILLSYTLREILIKILPPNHDRTQQITAIEQRITRLENEIIASVPQQIGHAPNTKEDILFSMTYPIGGLSATARSLLPFIHMSGGYSLVWPLFVVNGSATGTNEIREWVVRVLKIIASDMGVRQALVVADLVEANVDVVDVHKEHRIVQEPADYRP